MQGKSDIDLSRQARHGVSKSRLFNDTILYMTDESSSLEPVSPLNPGRMSLAARLLNIFAVPGEVFLDIRSAPHAVSNWLVPIILSSIVGVFSAVVIFSQPSIQQQIREQQSKAIELQVKAGKMTQAQADQSLAVMDKFMGPAMLKIFGAVGAVVSSFVRVFWWAFILWLMGQLILKIRFPYLKAVETAGLVMMISVLGMIISLLLIVNMGKVFASPSLALAVENFDIQSKSHVALGAANVFSFWFVGLMALGLAKLADVPFARAGFLVFGFWILQEMFFILTGLGQFAL